MRSTIFIILTIFLCTLYEGCSYKDNFAKEEYFMNSLQIFESKDIIIYTYTTDRYYTKNMLFLCDKGNEYYQEIPSGNFPYIKEVYKDTILIEYYLFDKSDKYHNTSKNNCIGDFKIIYHTNTIHSREMNYFMEDAINGNKYFDSIYIASESILLLYKGNEILSCPKNNLLFDAYSKNLFIFKIDCEKLIISYYKPLNKKTLYILQNDRKNLRKKQH